MAKKTIYLMPVRISKARIQRLYRRAKELAPIYAGEARHSCNRLCFHENDKMSAELEGQARLLEYLFGEEVLNGVDD